LKTLIQAAFGMDGDWYSRPILDRAYRRSNLEGFTRQLDGIAQFESTLADDGALVLKFWMHLSQDAQKRRLKSLEQDPLTEWRVGKTDWAHWKRYEKFVEAAERTILRTNTGKAPWTVVEGEDAAFRSLTVGTVIRDSLRTHLDKMRQARTLRNNREMERTVDSAGHTEAAKPGKDAAQPRTASSTPPTVLDTLDLTKQLGKQDYQRQLEKYQARASLLFRDACQRGISTIVVLEGPDAAGKGGAIRRLTAPLDARHYRVLPISVPTEEERAQHYLWRFWRHVSRAGRLTIFDRSWYGRVLVERVEGFAVEDEWKRAFAEINNFEEQLTEHGIILLKFWVHISKDEQLARFMKREQTPHKSWKLTDEDWRNREKWDDYQRAVNDMVQYTSTVDIPWLLVEGNDKYFARIKVLKNLCSRLEDALKKK
jgi:polyphosphate:AMP phosphotransferase